MGLRMLVSPRPTYPPCPLPDLVDTLEGPWWGELKAFLGQLEVLPAPLLLAFPHVIHFCQPLWFLGDLTDFSFLLWVTHAEGENTWCAGWLLGAVGRIGG